MPVFRWLDDNIEKVIILVNYVVMAGIIFVEVIRRFVFEQQAAWSSTIPIYLFLWITWVGCAYCCKTRTHLRFDELRTRLPYRGQFACMMLDHVVWIGFAILVIVFSVEQVQLSRDNFAIVQGTDDVLQWWFYLATPFSFSLIIFRVLQNFAEDVGRFRRGEPMLVKTGLAGE